MKLSWRELIKPSWDKPRETSIPVCFLIVWLSFDGSQLIKRSRRRNEDAREDASFRASGVERQSVDRERVALPFVAGEFYKLSAGAELDFRLLLILIFAVHSSCEV